MRTRGCPPRILMPGRTEEGGSHWGILGKAAVVAIGAVVVKFGVSRAGLEFVETLPLLTALMSGVVFTLAIILAGVLSDFKETERMISELASHFRRLHADLAIIAQGERLAALRGHVLRTAVAVRENLGRGTEIRLREIYAPLSALDRGVAEAAAAGAPTSPLRTIQVTTGSIVRIVDRLEFIVETTFLRAGYYYAAAVVAIAVVGLTFTKLGPMDQALFLYGFAVLLLSGLFFLVWDLDNPLAGNVRISTKQFEKLVRTLEESQASPPGSR
ncbi:MAG: hypothetical protein ACT4PT_02200 [Methanobacteriota archaeon]